YYNFSNILFDIALYSSQKFYSIELFKTFDLTSKFFKVTIIIESAEFKQRKKTKKDKQFLGKN
ncbi:hypothetical protein BpHYR1_025846, partial [Brachionus plicatilis]